MIARKRNKHAQSGFTLFETLITIMILLMVTSIVVAGIPVATRAYQRVTRIANAQVALSTTISVLQDELGTARDINCPDDDDKKITYLSSRTGNTSQISIINNVIHLQDYIDAEDKPKPRPLISEAMLGNSIKITYDKVSDNITGTEHIVTFEKLTVSSTNGETFVVNPIDLKIRVITP